MSLKMKFKRKLAGTLAFLTLFGAIPMGGITAHATELYPDNSMRNNGGGSTTSYYWITSGERSFDVAGITNPDLLNVPNRYDKTGGGNVKTTYNWEGYRIAIAPGDLTQNPTVPGEGNLGLTTNVTQSGVDPNYTNVRLPGNGQVGRITSAGNYDVEVQVKVYPSADEKWILVDYIVKNLEDQPSAVRIGSGTDVKVGEDDSPSTSGPADGAKLVLNDKGFRMVQEDTTVAGTLYFGTYETFELITQAPGGSIGEKLGVTPVDTRWAGRYSYYQRNYFTDLNSFDVSALNTSTHGQYKNGDEYYVHGIDSGLTYGWNIELEPFGTEMRRVAFGAKGPSFYVSSANGNAGATGAYDDPFDTIENAMAKIGSDMGYVLIQDYVPLTQPINVTSNITFQTADYYPSGAMIDGNTNSTNSTNGSVIENGRVVLTRDSGFSGPMFTTSGSSSAVRLTEIILDGENTEVDSAFVEASVGKVNIMSGAELRNNNVTDSAKGSAIHVTNQAELTMNFGTIKGNKSAGLGAVYFDGASFKIRNEVIVKDNSLNDGTTPANVYLASGKHMIIDGEGLSGAAEIGVTTQDIPVTSDINEEPQADEMVIVVKHDFTESSDTAAYQSYIQADQGLVVGLAQAPHSTDSSEDNNHIVLRKSGTEVIELFIDEDDVEVAAEQLSYIVAGDAVSATPKNPSDFTLVDGGNYEFKETIVVGDGLTVGSDGTVTGTMPNTTVTITYVYKKKDAVIEFDTQGGSPQPGSITGKAGDPILGNLPPASIMNRPGYVFAGWYKEAAGINEVTALSGNFAPGTTTFYAKWEASGTFDFDTRFVNSDESFEFDTTTAPYAVDASVSAAQRNVPGYKIEDIYVIPQLEDQNIDLPGTGTVTGRMKAQDSEVTYRYQVDYSLPPLNIKVRHEAAAGGATLHDTYNSTAYPEDTLSLAPETIYGYVYDSVEFVSGHQRDQAQMITGIEDTYGDTFAADGSLSTRMPNQDVEIVYKYVPSGEGYDFTAKYVYGTEAIRTPIVTQVPTAAPADHAYQAVYGYLYGGSTTKVPATASGSADAAGNFSGTMPNGSLTITLDHDKDLTKWADITYKAGVNGTLNITEPARPNVIPSGSDFTANVLMNDNSPEGDAGAYSWSTIQDKELVPNPKADRYYMFDQWYIDTNRNGVLDPGEEVPIADAYQFELTSTPVTLIANFVEDPSMWIDINLTAGENGSISGNTSYHIPYDKTWSDVTPLPSTHPIPNYLNDGWFDGTQRVQATTELADGKTYVHNFKKDPDIWGLPVNEPDATGMLDVDGSGKIIVHDVSEDYQYVVVDENGNVVAVKPGNDSGSLTFPDLYPGTEYQIYEVGLGETITPGMPIASVGDKSDPKDVLIPVLEDNYTVTPDTSEDGKVTLTINPADPDSKYAVIDEDGNVVIVDGADSEGWKTPEGGIVEFPGLDPNKEYTVVAIPKESTGVTPEDRIDKGSTVTTDPGVELNIPKYIVETIRGTVAEVEGESIDLDRYDQIEEGQLVKITAEPTDGNGNNFAYWKVIIGNVEGFTGKVTTLDVEFAMPSTNVVVAAYYDRPVGTPSNAIVEDEVRGGNQNEMTVNPNEIGNLEDLLTTDHDRELIDVNGAEVTYKIVFDKNRAKADEKAAIKADPQYDTGVDKELAFTAPWGLDIRLERYVNGRRVDRATASNATFDVIVQLEDEEIDMLDYQLYKVERDALGNITLSLVEMVDLPENNGGVGGLFHFEGEINGRYVLVYSKAYWVHFINNNFVQNDTHSYKVRKHYAINDPDYTNDFNMIWDTPVDEFDDNDGIHHTFKGWSTKKLPDAYKAYNPDGTVTKPLTLYGYYANNLEEVLDARDELEDLLDQLLDMADEYFLTAEEKQKIIDTVRDVQNVLNKTNPKATLEELLQAIEDAREVIDQYEPILKQRKEEYDNQHTSGNSSGGGGGTGGGGGKGKGNVANPYIPEKANSYTVGVNGNWEKLDDSGTRWAFALNGGIHLTGMWAWLEYTDENVSLTGWYHFNSKGEMDYGWFRDEKLNWYYCDTIHDGRFGLMKTGWHYDESDKHWYYLDPNTGIMATGWREIGGVWYYFTASNNQDTYSYDPVTERWSFMQVSARPLGSMYVSEGTPDGYQVNANGAWVR